MVDDVFNKMSFIAHVDDDMSKNLDFLLTLSLICVKISKFYSRSIIRVNFLLIL